MTEEEKELQLEKDVEKLLKENTKLKLRVKELEDYIRSLRIVVVVYSIL